MNVPVLSVRDKLIGFGSCFTAMSCDVAKRGFYNSIKYNKLDDCMSPEDLSLYHIGDMDTMTGIITPCEPELIIQGFEVDYDDLQVGDPYDI